ncbi:MAG TPA: hypothetical protein VFT15_08360, partial [Chitinophagaceae bacterium]|nr:hypothetical protein [Chitinophagaceae bacterium]
MTQKFVMLCLLVFISAFSSAQIPLTVLPSGGNKKAITGEQIGLTKVVINYDRPGVKGREGKIWGQLVHVGYTDPGFGNTKTAP